MLREHPQQQEATPAPEHSLVSHSQTCQVKLRSPSPTLPCPKKPMSKQMSSKQLEGAEGGLGELTYRFHNPQMLGVCWTCSQHCWRHTGTLCRKSCLPLGPPTGRRTSGTLESTGTVPGSLPPGRAACRAQNRSEATQLPQSPEREGRGTRGQASQSDPGVCILAAHLVALVTWSKLSSLSL